MKQLELAAAAALAILAAGPLADASAAANATAPAQSPGVLSAVPKYTPAMRDLLDAAQALRESIQVMARKPEGAERDAAMDEARRALRQAQRSMLDLPPNLRSTGDRIVDHRPAPVSTSEKRGSALEELRQASDRLFAAVTAMYAAPSMSVPEKAIADAHLALADAQGAMSTLQHS
ncbi:MAG TPA: hypothetical protein VNU21_01645 [Usitatibacter sp.]|jgi:hypothetical protein|nr:hypothetical protein [Usitatibacter sp.]